MKIVAAIDGSPTADRALAWAVAETALRSASLAILYAFAVDGHTDPHDAHEAAVAFVRDALSRVTGAADGDVTIDVQPVRGGAVAAAIIHGTRDADLVVLGSRGLGGFSGLVLGSISQQVAAHATVPVAVIPPGATVAQPDDDAAVVVGVDGSASSRRALRWAAEEGAERGTAVDAVHVHQAIDTVVADITRTAIAVLEEAAAERAHADLMAVIDEELGGSTATVRPHVVVGSPARVLIERAATPASVLVIGSRGHGGFRGLLLGSVSQQCLAHARGPVVIVHAT